ncbi:MAG: autotransporter outer membrane beta-barrel domain-containing protein [Planctomycetota bacterium]|nr:autotransporter outer membrane beta-barrel domain-containing protein [Planctomycetota bacterium]
MYFSRALRSASQKSTAKNAGNKWNVFADTSAGYTKYERGSYQNDEDLGNFNLMVGLDRLFDLGCGNLTVGGFFEYGLGYHSGRAEADRVLGGIIPVHGSQKNEFTSQNFGGGLFAQYNSPDFGPGHFYADGAFRMGAATNSHKSDSDASVTALTTGTLNLDTRFDSTRLYVGADFALGYVWEPVEKLAVNVYGRGSYLFLGDDSGTVHSNSKGTGPVFGNQAYNASASYGYRFDSLNSFRLRPGARVSYAATNWLTPYIGAAYEYDFTEADHFYQPTVNARDVQPDLSGSTGILEAGLYLRPLKSLSVNLGAQGYVGNQSGIAGLLSVGLSF